MPDQDSAASRAAVGVDQRFSNCATGRVEEMIIDHDGALDLAARTGLTAYDASHLWLARQLGAELVTLDRRLERATS